jgi:hypothetical protein
MTYHVYGLLDEKVWLFRQRRWAKIQNPLKGNAHHSGAVPPAFGLGNEAIHDFLQEYAYTQWHLGPTPLLPHYPGTLVYVYNYRGERKAPTFLIWIDTVHVGVIVYAQELPDLLELLSMLTHIVLVGILEDAHIKSQRRFRRS